MIGKADRLFIDVGDETRLRGGRCPACDTHVFPRQGGCPRCGGDLIDTALPAAGTVWSSTVQRIAPKPPYQAGEAFQPYAVAYVDLGPVLVETPLGGRPPEQWTIGDQVRLVVPSTPPGEQPGWRFWFEGDEP
jgi:uncharacterized OB-fold protein